MPTSEASSDRLEPLHDLTQDFAPMPPLKSAMLASSPLPSDRTSSKRRESSRSRYHDKHAESKRSKKDIEGEKEREEDGEHDASRRSQFRYNKYRSFHREHHHKDPSSQSTGSKRREQTYHASIEVPIEYDDAYIPNLSSTTHSTDAGFRPLLDAVEDDEGDESWEIPAQSIYTFAYEYTEAWDEIETIDDEESARHVREKSREHTLEERRHREKQEEKEKARKRAEEEELRQREREERREKRKASSSQTSGSKRRKQTHYTSFEGPIASNDAYAPNISSRAYSTDAAFRHLFDTLEDEEGDASWDIPAQLIHTFAYEYTES
ncbi:hypothetical protein RUND412_008412 [Rhizina undulata]